MTDGRTLITLAPHEIRHATLIGVGRDLAAKQQGRTPIYTGSNTFLGNIIGALGEMAVAKALNVYWSPNVGGNDHAEGDVGVWQVRSTTKEPGRLVIRDRDADDALFVLVTGTPPRLCIAGWLYAAEGKQADWRHNDEYLVPPTVLHDWESRPR